jgi:hypothetical protein
MLSFCVRAPLPHGGSLARRRTPLRCSISARSLGGRVRRGRLNDNGTERSSAREVACCGFVGLVRELNDGKSAVDPELGFTMLIFVHHSVALVIDIVYDR